MVNMVSHRWPALLRIYPSLAKSPLNYNGILAKSELTFLQEVTNGE